MGSRKRSTSRETGGIEPGRLPLVAEPAAYLTGSSWPSRRAPAGRRLPAHPAVHRGGIVTTSSPRPTSSRPRPGRALRNLVPSSPPYRGRGTGTRCGDRGRGNLVPDSRRPRLMREDAAAKARRLLVERRLDLGVPRRPRGPGHCARRKRRGLSGRALVVHAMCAARTTTTPAAFFSRVERLGYGPSNSRYVRLI